VVFNFPFIQLNFYSYESTNGINLSNHILQTKPNNEPMIPEQKKSFITLKTFLKFNKEISDIRFLNKEGYFYLVF